MNGYKVLGIILATVGFYAVGMIWYGFAFSDLWMAGQGVTEADYENNSPAWMGLGVLLTLMQVIGISYILSWKGRPEMPDAVQSIGMLSVLLAAAFSMYALAYLPQHSVPLFLIDASHLILGWIIAAAVLTKFREN